MDVPGITELLDKLAWGSGFRISAGKAEMGRISA